MIFIKSKSEIEIMKRPAAIVAEALELIREAIKPGVTTQYLDEIAESYIRKKGA